MSDYKRYEEQFKALMNVLRLLETKHANSPMFVNLLQGLRLFAYGQFYFFYHGFSASRPKPFPKLHPNLSPDDAAVQFAPEHVFAVTLHQIAADLSTIQRAAEQSLDGWRIDFGNNHDFLEFAGRIAWATLWHPANDTDIKAVIPYATDSVEVRVMPYAPVMLLGMPLTCLKDPYSFLSIPHEVGHFRYYFSFPQTPNAAPRRRARNQQQKPWLNLRELFYPFRYQAGAQGEAAPSWGEEIFADVYGALVGGPAFIASAMDLALEHSIGSLLSFDLADPHPTPLIRPLLMLKALRQLNSKPVGKQGRLLDLQENVVEALAIYLWNGWKRKLQERGILAYADRSGAEKDNSRDLHFVFRDAELAKRVREIVVWDSRDLDPNLAVEALVINAIEALRHAFPDVAAAQVPWGWSATEPRAWVTAGEMYALLNKAKPERTNTPGAPVTLGALTPAAEVALAQALPELWIEWATTKKRYFKASLPDEIWAGEFESAMDPQKRPTNTWLPVFGAGGWTTEGPCHVPSG